MKKEKLKEEFQNVSNLHNCLCCAKLVFPPMANKIYCDPCSLERKKHLKKQSQYKFRVRKHIRDLKDRLEKLERFLENE